MELLRLQKGAFGGWKEGMMHDRGIYYFANGDELEGTWREGRYHGLAYFRGADGTVSRRVGASVKAH